MVDLIVNGLPDFKSVNIPTIVLSEPSSPIHHLEISQARVQGLLLPSYLAGALKDLRVLTVDSITGPSFNRDFQDIKSVTSLRSLETIRFSGCELHGDFSDLQLSKLTKLTHLDMSRNDITQLPADIFKLSQLKFLNVSVNDISGELDGPDDPTEFALETLDLSINGLVSSPSFDRWNRLRHLDLAHNDISSNIHLANMAELSYLRISFNPRLTSVVMEKLPSLRQAILNSNAIRDFSSTDFAALSKLEILNLYRNNLTSVPSSIGLSKSLHSLVLYNNRLRGLPRSFARLNSSTNVGLGDNGCGNVWSFVEDDEGCYHGLVPAQNLSVFEIGHKNIEPYQAQGGTETIQTFPWKLDVEKKRQWKVAGDALPKKGRMGRIMLETYFDTTAIAIECPWTIDINKIACEGRVSATLPPEGQCQLYQGKSLMGAPLSTVC